MGCSPPALPVLFVSPPCRLFPPCGSCSLGEASRSGGKGQLRPPPASWFRLKVAGFSERLVLRAGALSWLRRRKEGPRGRKEKHEGRLDEGNGAGERDGDCGSPTWPRCQRPRCRPGLTLQLQLPPLQAPGGRVFGKRALLAPGKPGGGSSPGKLLPGEKWWLQAASHHRHGHPAFPTGLGFYFILCECCRRLFWQRSRCVHLWVIGG